MDIVDPVFTWISTNPTWAGFVVFLVAFFESLALVGLVLPGAVMMFGIGALVGGGVMPLWPTLIWAAAGAIAGDGISFWLGRTLHMRIKTLWPLNKHPELIANATNFFHRHGGKSILFGRFIGPIRPVIPAVAGMLEMSPQRFFIVNVISGILWAPVYVFPGILFAASLGLAAEVTSRLAVVLGTVGGTLLLALWLLRILFNRAHRYAYPLIQRTLAWANLHPRMGRIPASLLDPEQPEARGLTLLALLLLITATLFALVAHASGASGLLFNLDRYLHIAAASLRTPAMDDLFVTLAQLADWQVLLPLSLAVFAWLWRCCNHHAARHWLAAVGIGTLLSFNLLWLEGPANAILPAPLHSGQLMTAMAVYGFLAIIIAREFPEPRRWPIYALVTVLLLGIAMARLYLGASRLSGVMGALTLGAAWVSLLGIAYRHHPAERVQPAGLAGIAILVLVVAAGWHEMRHHETTLQRYSTVPLEIVTTRSDWLEERWQELPTYRDDLRGIHNHPLDLQYADDLKNLEQQLLQHGWYKPREVTALNWLIWLAPDTPLKQIPVLPQVHNGSNEALLLVKEVKDKKQWLALRLWPSGYRLEEKDQPLWIGNVSLLQPTAIAGLTVPRTQSNFDRPLQQLLTELSDWQIKKHRRKSDLKGWSGEVVLLNPKPQDAIPAYAGVMKDFLNEN
jgi:membrane protein DedA with SNARE-associated domain